MLQVGAEHVDHEKNTDSDSHRPSGRANARRTNLRFRNTEERNLMNISLSLNCPHISILISTYSNTSTLNVETWKCRNIPFSLERFGQMFLAHLQVFVLPWITHFLQKRSWNIMDRTGLTSPQGWHLKVSQSFPCQEPRRLARKSWMLIFMWAVKSKLRRWQIGQELATPNSSKLPSDNQTVKKTKDLNLKIHGNRTKSNPFPIWRKQK